MFFVLNLFKRECKFASLTPLSFNILQMVESTRVKKDIQEVEDEATYEGEWNQDDQRDGFGIQIWVDGERYEGQWSNDMMNDTKGIMTWPGGVKYVGSYVDNLQCGHGVFTDEDGKYTGEWKDDM